MAVEVVSHPSAAPDNVPPEKCLWVDDAKVAPEGFAVARTYDDALRMLRRFRYDVLYLDHDLGDGPTGLDLLRQIKRDGRCPPRVYCISWNPVGRQRILAELGAASQGSKEGET